MLCELSSVSRALHNTRSERLFGFGLRVTRETEQTLDVHVFPTHSTHTTQHTRI